MYEGICVDCEEEVANGKRDNEDVGVYVGESSRSLARGPLNM